VRDAQPLGDGLARRAVDLPDEGDEPALAFYYPGCGEREFE
jgi:hypothetical protein